MTALRVIGLAAAAILLAAACDDGLSHPFGGYAYDPEGDCLKTSGIIDVLVGPPKTCKVVRCYEAPDGDVFVTETACDAPPDFVDKTAATEGRCVKALAAYADEGHGRCPRAPHDAGTGGGQDAGAGGGS